MFGFALVLAAVAAALAVFHRLPGEFRDFEVYWTAASRARHAEPLYPASDGHYQHKYLPVFAILALPATLVPLQTGKALWFVTCAALLPLLIGMSIALLPSLRRPRWLLAIIALVVMGKFYGHELVLGQVNMLFAVIVCVAILVLRGGHDIAAAALIVLAIAVKPYAILFLPWLALTRGCKVVVASTVALAALLMLPALLYGIPQTIELHHQWWTTVTASTAPNLTNNDNVSLAGMYTKWLGAEAPAPAATVMTSIVLLALLAYVIVRGRGLACREALEGALLLTIIPLLSPQGWDYVFLIATPGVVLFANYDDTLPPALRWMTWAALAVIGLSLFDLMGRERYAMFMAWSVITWCFLLLAAALATLRRGRVV